MEGKKENEKYEKFAAGVVVLRAQDANWNADFSGWPRKLPEGRFYSTDKALKYAIRKYLKEMKNEKVLMWRVYDEEGDVGNLVAMLEKNDIKSTDKDLVKKVLGCIDIRLFGGTFTLKENNFSITGPVQITYGVDVWGNGKTYVSQIQSPKYEGGVEGAEEAKPKYGSQSTLGSEVRLTEAHYAFDFTINPNNLSKDSFINSVVGQNGINISFDDIQSLKESFINGPNYVTSTTKTGVFTELLIFAEFDMRNNLVPLTPILKNGIKVGNDKENNGLKREIDIENVVKVLSGLGAKEIEVYYNPDLAEIKDESEIKKLGNVKIKKIKVSS